MTTAQQQMRWAEELIATARRKRNLESNPYELVDSNPIATNFGNKFNRNAPYVRAGALDVPRGSATYTETVKYHDYERRIVARNPLLFDSVGDVVETESSDEEGDKPEGSYMEDHPYSDINLDELLAPLTSASDLPTHPRLSRPYENSGLLETIRKAEATLHLEQEKLRALNEQFIRHRGDAEWAPVGDMHTEYDDWLRATVFDGTPLAAETNGLSKSNESVAQSLAWQRTANEPSAHAQANGENHEADEVEHQEDGDVSMLGAPQIEATATASNTREHEPQENGNNNSTLPNGTSEHLPTSKTNGISSHHGDPLPERDLSVSTNAMGIPDAMIIDTTTSEPANTQRMTTRALANSTTSEEIELPIHPFFIAPPPRPIPQSLVQEEDPLGMLLSYTSKQAEIVRQWHELHEGLLQTLRLSKNVMRWSKAEGHVGELSDNEDWVDLDEWGLKPDELKKGKDEDEELQTVEGTGRRGGRRGRGGGAAGGGVERG